MADLKKMGNVVHTEMIGKELALIGQAGNVRLKTSYESFANVVLMMWMSQCEDMSVLVRLVCEFIQESEKFVPPNFTWRPLHLAIETLSQLTNYVRLDSSNQE